MGVKSQGHRSIRLFVLISKGLRQMQKGLTRCVGIFAIVLGLFAASAATADEAVVTGNGSGAAQLHFQIIIPAEISAAFQASSEPMVFSNGGSLSYTLADYRAVNLDNHSQLATIAVP